MPFQSTFLFSPLEMYTGTGQLKKKRKDGLSWRHWCWKGIPMNSDINTMPKPNISGLESLSTFHKSASKVTWMPAPTCNQEFLKLVPCTCTKRPSTERQKRTMPCEKGNSRRKLSECTSKPFYKRQWARVLPMYYCQIMLAAKYFLINGS